MCVFFFFLFSFCVCVWGGGVGWGENVIFFGESVVAINCDVRVGEGVNGGLSVGDLPRMQRMSSLSCAKLLQ